MELKLVVLAGAKEGTQIPLKKDKFLIGRSTECTLRAGSSAISRRHCGIVRTNGQWLVRDLNSRNGTFLNDQAVKEPTPLSVGDELRVGPLKFRVEEYVQPAAETKPAAPVKPETKTATDKPGSSLDIKRGKQPPVKNVAEVAERTVSKSEGSTSEDDISRWLLGIDTGNDESLRETQTLSMEETTTIGRSVPIKGHPADDDAEDIVSLDDAEQPKSEADEKADEKTESGGWGLFKFGKKAAKKKPGKLPPRPAEQSKDSREAAADILRAMTRRR